MQKLFLVTVDCRRRIVDFKVHPPSDLDDMADIASAFAKVISSIEQLR